MPDFDGRQPVRGLSGAGALAALSLIAVVFLGHAAGEQKAERDAKAVAKMVEDIASRNKAPKIVDLPNEWPRKVPRFPKSYDWKEQERVYKALAKLYKDTSVELWEELVRKAGDRRYSLTIVSQQSGNSRNDTVGNVCRRLAYDRLIDVFQRHMPAWPERCGWTVRLDVGIEDLAAWRKKRNDKSLYQLQIEVCERALKEVQKVKGISQEMKDEARKKIKSEIKKLTRTKRPFQIKSDPFSELWAPYTDGTAK
jgi:hypothetical protein